MAAPRTTIARLRWHRGLTQGQLATLSGVSIKTIEKIEAGKSKGSPRTALLLAGPLATDVEEIVEALIADYVGGQDKTSEDNVVHLSPGADGETEQDIRGTAAEA